MIKFWNGNKSSARQDYEYELLECLVKEAQKETLIDNDLTDYPCAQDEGNVLENGCDVLVTVAGNRKFAGKPLIEIKQPLCNGLLGWRLCIVATDRVDEFENLTLAQLKGKKLGVPATWVDAELFRANGFNVLEQGNLDDMLGWVQDGSVDFITLGANEAHDILAQNRHYSDVLSIESTMAIYYPFPLVFYVNQQQEELAELLSQQLFEKKSQVAELFNHHYGDVIRQAALQKRRKLSLSNPLLSDDYHLLLEEYEPFVVE